MFFLSRKIIFLFLLLAIIILACAKKQIIDFNEIRKAADLATEQIENQYDSSSKKTTSANSTIQKINVPSNQNVWEDNDWIVSVADCPAVNISRQEAMRQALNEARKNAIGYAVGIQISSSQLLSQSSNRLTTLTSYINISSYGKIIEEQEPKWEEFEIGKNQKGLTLWNYQVTLKCKVQKEEGHADPGFSLNLRANKLKYKMGDDILFRITSSRDCYLTVFNFYESGDKVFIIFPNDFDSNNKLVANQPRIIPAPTSGIAFEALLPEGYEESHELIIAVATNEPIDFSEGLDKISAFSYISTPVAAVTEINRRLVTIPLNERTQTSDILLIEK